MSSVVVQRDGKPIVVGSFTSVNGVARSGVARLNTDGSLDTNFVSRVFGFEPNNVSISAVALQRDGKVLIGGRFATVNGAPAAYVARLWDTGNIQPLIKCISRSEGNVNLVWEAIPNRTYRVQYKASLSGDNWADLDDGASATGATAMKTDTSLCGATQRFYRVVLKP